MIIFLKYLLASHPWLMLQSSLENEIPTMEADEQ